MQRTPFFILVILVLAIAALVGCSEPNTSTAKTLPVGPAVIISGTVVDALDIAIPNAEVVIQSRRQSNFFGGDFFWEQLDGYSATTTAEGTFSILGELENDFYRLAISHEGFATTYRPFGPDDINIILKRIIAQRSWSISGKVLIDEEFNDVFFITRLVPLLADPNAPDERYGILDSNNGWEKEGVPPGQFVFELATDPDALPLYSRNITLGPEGGLEKQPDIDLRGAIKEINLTLSGEDSEGVISGFWVEDLDGARLGYTLSDSISILTTKPTLDIRVGAVGYRSVILSEVSGDMTVTLPRGIMINLSIETPEIPDTWYIYGLLTPVSNNTAPKRYDSQPIVIYELDDTALGLPYPGSFQLEVTLLSVRDIEGFSAGVVPREIIGAELEMPLWEVKDTEEIQNFHHKMTSAQTQKILDIIREADEYERSRK